MYEMRTGISTGELNRRAGYVREVLGQFRERYGSSRRRPVSAAEGVERITPGEPVETPELSGSDFGEGENEIDPTTDTAVIPLGLGDLTAREATREPMSVIDSDLAA
jgi:hypothetical protein